MIGWSDSEQDYTSNTMHTYHPYLTGMLTVHMMNSNIHIRKKRIKLSINCLIDSFLKDKYVHELSFTTDQSKLRFLQNTLNKRFNKH